MRWISALTCEPDVRPEGRVQPDGTATTEAGSSLWLLRAGGPWGRARGLLRMPGLIDRADEVPTETQPTALWLGRTPQVHTLGMRQPIGVVTADIARRGPSGRRPCALRVRRVDVLAPGELGRWCWSAPITIELHPGCIERFGLMAGTHLNLEWGRPARSTAPRNTASQTVVP